MNLKEVELSQIVKDITRSMPDHMYFKEDEGQGQRTLFGVLKCVSLLSGKSGYVQSFCYLASLLMIYMTPEESLEMMLTILNDYGMMDYVQPGPPGVFKSFYTLKKLTEKFLPKVHELFTAVDFRPEMYATR